MNNVTENFVLALTPKYWSHHNLASKVNLTWIANPSGYRIGFNGSWTDVSEEYEAWNHVRSVYPSIFDELRKSPFITTQGYALRGEMMLGLGAPRMEELTQNMRDRVFELYTTAMEVLAATKTAKATPKVTRVSHGKSLSWLEVRTKVIMPSTTEPFLLSVRCLPSPYEEDTWSVRLRMPMLSEEAYLDVQRAYEDLVARMSYRGVTIKDVQNGTVFDL